MFVSNQLHNPPPQKKIEVFSSPLKVLFILSQHNTHIFTDVSLSKKLPFCSFLSFILYHIQFTEL